MAQAVSTNLSPRKPGIDPRPDRLVSMVINVPVSQEDHMLVTNTTVGILLHGWCNGESVKFTVVMHFTQQKPPILVNEIKGMVSQNTTVMFEGAFFI
jgi:hypothetical protein